MNFFSVTGKNWKLKEIDKRKIFKISEDFSISEILSRLLVLRNISPEEIYFYLNPKLKYQMPKPQVLHHMDKATTHIVKLINNKALIGIFGDYDVDGAASTSLLIKFFNKIKQPFEMFIPDRKKDGYGPNINTFNNLIKKRVKTIITVDCGTSSYDAINFANKKKIKTIVLDHHQSDVKLPSAYAILNPNKISDNSGLNYLCATSVVFFFLVGLNQKLKKIDWYKINKITEPNLFNELDLVALATICDVMPLIGLNRVFVKQGLKILKKKQNLGLRALSDICNIQSTPNEHDLGFIFGPRINAGGRLGFSDYGTKLLSTDNIKIASKLSLKLNDLNEKRREIEEIHLKEIEIKLSNNIKNSVVILYDKSWHEGLSGILASRIKDKLNRPIVILTDNKNYLKGSARSVHGFDIGSIILKGIKKNIIIQGGGHKMAAGFTVKKTNIDILQNYLNKEFNKVIKDLDFNKKIVADAIISSTAINENFYKEINLIAPFGPGNPQPNFILENVKVLKSKIINNKHLNLTLISKNNKFINAICFNAMNSKLEPYLTNHKKYTLNILGRINANEWKGRKKMQFMIKDIAIN